MSADKNMLEALHEAVASDLLTKIKSGEAKASDLAVAVKFLKDNGIEAIPANNNPLAGILAALPFADDVIRQ